MVNERRITVKTHPSPNEEISKKNNQLRYHNLHSSNGNQQQLHTSEHLMQGKKRWTSPRPISLSLTLTQPMMLGDQ